jgi:uncharacterized protein YcbX
MMTEYDKQVVGTVATLWRYPVKSLQGEELNSVQVVRSGFLGDRARALVETASGKVVSAKNPKKWPALFRCRARYETPPSTDQALPIARIELPDGTLLTSDQEDIDLRLSDAFGRDVKLESTLPAKPTLEELWPDLETFKDRNQVTDEAIKPDSFFDGAAVHLLTVATLDHLRKAYPLGRFEVKRFRPNIVVDCPPELQGFVENDWIGHTVAIGPEVQLEISRPCPRCVMTTLPQSDLPRDLEILRTVVQKNNGNAGVFVAVIRGGTIRQGDEVVLLNR